MRFEVNKFSENGGGQCMDEVYGVFGRCFVKGSRWFEWWKMKKNGDEKPETGLGVRTDRVRPDGFDGSGISQGFWERKERLPTLGFWLLPPQWEVLSIYMMLNERFGLRKNDPMVHNWDGTPFEGCLKDKWCVETTRTCFGDHWSDFRGIC